jgi:LacI family transcriptional regulator
MNLLPKNLSQKSIAEEVGVSVMTVSRVMRGKSDVAIETRKQILEAIKKHKYRPNLLVKGMQTGKTNTIGLVIPAREFDYHIISGAHDELINWDYVPYILWSANDAVDSNIDAEELKQIHRLVDRRVDGIILKPTNEQVDDRYLREIWERNIPLVVVDREMTHTHADFVGTDDYWGGKIVAEYLFKLGHKKFAQVSVDNRVITFKLRREGFCDVISSYKDASCTTVEAACVNDPAMEDIIRELLTQTPRPTAVFVPVDSIAVTVYSVARSLGIRIPQDLSVVGFGNLQISTALFPTLTTLEQSPYKIGRTAASLILERLNNQQEMPESKLIKIKPELIIRDSTAKPQS